HGKGLWSTLWGFISIGDDYQTIQGITYYSHGETPGLGGEVDNPIWKAKWEGKQAYKDGEVAIHVVKGEAHDNYSVDGLSGATMTSNGVTNMLKLWLGDMGYGKYLTRLREQSQTS
ncbi:MAG: NADH:ubiquinone reductase (Na(+)-transporting) subunit C, partial [Deltaproteobacteria bacterium]|nr:NADH:ubiquinone reductase (Na(+)-transporting) subunit C [Deltaproteobacteria bacterium]